MSEWRPIKKLLPEDGEVLIFAPNEKPNVVSGRLVAENEGEIEFYVEYTEQLLNDAIGEIIEPTHFMPLPKPPGGEG